MAVIEGLDVSVFQGDITQQKWHDLKGSGIDFVFMRASAGLTYTDPTFANNAARAKSATVLRGAFHFFQPQSSAEQQADLFLSAISGHELDLPPVLDVEVGGFSGDELAQRVQAWLERVNEKLNQDKKKPPSSIIYTSVGTWRATPRFGAYPLWVAHWGVTRPSIPNGWSTWHFWQHSGDGNGVPGILGNVDRDRWNGSLSALKTWAEGNSPPPKQYIVKEKDTLASIAEAQNISVAALIDYNPTLLLVPGQEIKLPAKKDVTPPFTLYTVQPGDTLSAIAKRFEVSQNTIVIDNNIDNPNVLFVGQVLRIRK